MKFLSDLKNKNLSNKTCLLRVDFNLTDDDLKKQKVPLKIKATLPTIKFLTERGAKVVILSHRGRPKINIKYQIANSKKNSLKPFVKILSSLLKKPVHFIDFDKKTNFIKVEDVQKIHASINGSVFLVENLRLLKGEEENSIALAKKLSSLGDFHPHTKRGLAPYGVGVYVNDAFSVSHRENASVSAITKFLPSYAGLSLENELKNLSEVMRNSQKPLVVILGGAKISDKIGVIKNFLKRADKFLIGGGVANTFMAAQGLKIGNSLYEKEMIPTAQKLLKSPKIFLPVDLITEENKILDIGPKTVKKYGEIIKNAKTIIWNGPMGYIENPKFAKGTEAVIRAIIKSRAFSIIGGGETITSLKIKNQKSKIKNKLFLSTGGGAMLEYLAGKKLPGIIALEKSTLRLSSGLKKKL